MGINGVGLLVGVQGSGLFGLYGSSSSSAGAGLAAVNSSSGNGVTASSATGTGVSGVDTGNGNTGTLGDVNGFGVYGSSSANIAVDGVGTNNTGVRGIDSTNSNFGTLGDINGYGVYGASSTNISIKGVSTNNSGVHGVNSTHGNFGTLGDANGYGAYGTSLTADGMHGVSSDASGSGVSGIHTTSGNGVYGRSSTGPGMRGIGAVGGRFEGTVNDGIDVQSDDALAYGLQATDSAISSTWAELVGEQDAGFGRTFGVLGECQVSDGEGVVGIATATIGIGTAGVDDDADGGTGIFGEADELNGNAGYFNGNTTTTGSSDIVRIDGVTVDDPIDRANKVVHHAAMQSNEPENVYNGNVVTDSAGRATVVLPDYCEAYNRDFRYQLTVIGQFAQAIVGSEIANNKFTILTDKPGIKVSWQVTGVRNDAYSQQHPFVDEEQKSANEEGYYLDPESYGQTREKGIAALLYGQVALRRP